MTKKQKKVLIRIIIAAVLVIALQFIPVKGYVRFGLYMIPYLVIGYDILKKAGKGILNRQIFDENFLMAVATIGAIALGDYKEGTAVMLFYQIGELFQSYAVGKSRRNISDLMDIRPDYANVEKDGELEQVDPDEIEIGTVIVVQPGEKVPIDGVVVEGTSSLNTSALRWPLVVAQTSPTNTPTGAWKCGGTWPNGCVQAAQFRHPHCCRLISAHLPMGSTTRVSRFSKQRTRSKNAWADQLTLQMPLRSHSLPLSCRKSTATLPGRSMTAGRSTTRTGSLINSGESKCSNL